MAFNLKLISDIPEWAIDCADELNNNWRKYATNFEIARVIARHADAIVKTMIEEGARSERDALAAECAKWKDEYGELYKTRDEDAREMERLRELTKEADKAAEQSEHKCDQLAAECAEKVRTWRATPKDPLWHSAYESALLECAYELAALPAVKAVLEKGGHSVVAPDLHGGGSID